MKIGNKIKARHVLIGLAFASFPFFLITLLFAFSLYNPMSLAFLTKFTVKNQSGKALIITPIGAVGKEGIRYPLPLSVSSEVYQMSNKTAEFLIKSGETLEFVYDWDDIQFSEILIKDSSGLYRILPTGLNPTENQYTRPNQTNFVIPPVNTLEFASEIHLQNLQTQMGNRFIFYCLAAVGLLFPLFISLLTVFVKYSSV